MSGWCPSASSCDRNACTTRDGRGATAALYLVVSLVAGLVAVALGVGVTRRILSRPVPAFDPELDE